MLRRIGIMAVLSLIVTALAAVPALAQEEATAFRVDSVAFFPSEVTVVGVVDHLPSGTPVDIVLTAYGTGTVQCLAPKGGILKVFPGASITNTGTATNLVPEPSGLVGWNVGFSVTANTPTAAAKTCPKRWTVYRIDDVRWMSFTLDAYQNNTLVAHTQGPISGGPL